jgi:hypothetical protein
VDVFQPHAQKTDGEIAEFLESPAPSVEPIKQFTPKEIKEEIGLLNTKKSAGHGLNNSKNVKGITPERLYPTRSFI